MKISYNWLKEYIALRHQPEELGKLLTDCGLEVESVHAWESVPGGLKGIVIGEVLECTKHPNADKLTVCRVNTGDKVRQIVCGAPNVAAGQKVAVALPGAVLHPSDGESFEIRKSKIRGEESEGMICAEDEIGLGESHAGIMVLDPGAETAMPAAEYFKVTTDTILEIGLTPNRADAASHVGVARDVKAVYSLEKPVSLAQPDITGFLPSADKMPFRVEVKEEAACIRYSGLYINNINIGESPQWLKDRLKAVGLRPINNIVDITNYVMMETGQPLHAFDANKIEGNEIIIKTLEKGASFTTLDGVQRKLNGDELMICNASGGMCIAGVFGGMDSGVTNQTTSIFLESACFAPAGIRKTAKYHGLHTDSSFRFERGTDPEGTVFALKRAAVLISGLAGGKVASEIIDIYNHPAKPFEVRLKWDYLSALSGIHIPANEVKSILNSLDIIVHDEKPEYLDLLVPSYRVDVTRPADVVEEIMRIYGYNKAGMPAKISMSMPDSTNEKELQCENRMASYLVSSGFHEIINNSLTKAQYSFTSNAVEILNPLSNELSILRDSMLMPGLETVLYNINRQQEIIRLFERGKVYEKSGNGYRETEMIALWLAGKRFENNWQKENKPYDIYYLKSIIINMLLAGGVNEKFTVREFADEKFDQGLGLSYKDQQIAVFGFISKKMLKAADLSLPVLYAEAPLPDILKLSSKKDITIRDAGRFPEVHRDLSMVLDASVKYDQVEALAFKTDSKILKRVNLFDVFEGEKIGAGKKSYALSFTLYDESATLQDKQIEQVMQKLMNNFEKELGAVIRKQ